MIPDAEEVGTSPGSGAMNAHVNKRKQAAAARPETEGLFRLFVQHVPAAVAMFDRQMRYLVVSRRWLEDYGLAGRQVIGLCHYDVLPEIPERWKHLHRRCLAGETLRCDEDPFPRADGRLDWVRWELRPWHNAAGHVGGVILFTELITARKQAEAALRMSEQKYRRLHETMRDAFVIVDMAGRIQDCNAAYREMLGYTEAELHELTYVDLTPPKWHEVEGKIVSDQIMPTGQSDVYEKEYQRKDGTVLPVELRVFLIRDDRGQPRQMWAIVRDITARKQAEAALLESETRLRAIVDTAIEGVVTIDERGRIESANPAALKMFGYAAHEVIGRNVSMLMPSPYREAHDQYLASYLRTGERKIIGIGREVEGRRKNGQRFPLEMSVTEVVFNAQRRFAGFLRDITDRQQAGLALRESEERYRSLVEATPDGILLVRRGRIALVNRAGLRMLAARSADEVLGRPVFDFFRPGRGEYVQAFANEGATPLDCSPVIEEELRRLDGGVRLVSLTARTCQIDGHSAELFVLRDITELRKLEAGMLAATEREQLRIGRDLHDGLGQKLTGLEMKSYGLMEDLSAGDLVPRRAKLRAQARDLNASLRECVTLTRSIAHGLAPMVLRTGGLVGALRELARKTRVPGKLTCRFICARPVIVEDIRVAEHFYRIAQEAVANSIKHGRARRISLFLTTKDGALTLRIQDDGRGLPAKPPAGAGLGLEIMRHRAHLLGAELDLQSQRGQGLTITCRLTPKSS